MLVWRGMRTKCSMNTSTVLNKNFDVQNVNLYKNCSECEQIYLWKRILKSFNVKEYVNYAHSQNISIYYIDTSVLLERNFGSFPSIILSMSFCLYNKKNITRRLEDMNFIFSWQKKYFTHSLRSFVKYCFATRQQNSYLRATV